MACSGLASVCSRPQLLLVLVVVALASLHSAAASYSSWHECSAQAIYGGTYGRQALTSLQDFRSQLLKHVWKTFDPMVPGPMGFDRFQHLKPFLKCPPHAPLVRYGSKEDGGKLLCDVSRLIPPCLIYSLGSNGDYSFELDMLNVTKCEIHTCDCTYDGVSQHPRRHFYHKWCVGAQETPNFKTWEQITRELGHEHRTLDVFKVDIEGHEPGVLAELRHNLPLPRQIVIEIHMRPPGGTMIEQPAPRTPAQLALLMLHLATLGYGIVGQEDNIWGEGATAGQGCCAEWTFLHVEQPWVGSAAVGSPASFLSSSRHKRRAGVIGGRHLIIHKRPSSQIQEQQQLAAVEQLQAQQQEQQQQAAEEAMQAGLPTVFGAEQAQPYQPTVLRDRQAQPSQQQLLEAGLLSQQQQPAAAAAAQPAAAAAAAQPAAAAAAAQPAAAAATAAAAAAQPGDVPRDVPGVLAVGTP